LTKCVKQKEEEDAVKKEEQLKEAIQTSGEGSRVPLCSTLPASHGLSDIYLKHPGDESSEDEEGTEKDINDESDDGEYRISRFCMHYQYLVCMTVWNGFDTDPFCILQTPRMSSNSKQ
jgi:hypothetical protein